MYCFRTATLLAVCATSILPGSHAFLGSSSLPGLRNARHPAVAVAQRGNRAAATGLRMQETEVGSESYTIVPSALAGEGGGWTIKGLKPPPAQGTVWARARPKVGEVLKMGAGSFGTIYIGFDLKTGEEVAVKTEPDYGLKTSMLRHEGEMLVQLQGSPGISKVHWIGTRELVGEDSNIMVMELLGPDMEHLLEFLDTRSFTPKTGLMLCRQMIECLEAVHAAGIVHRDIKPENFLMGVGPNANKVYLIDFGLADWYVDENGDHVPQTRTTGEMRGTVRYASTNKHNCISEARRDDLEELMTVVVYLMCGPLPWQSSELGTIDGLADTRSGNSRRRQLETIKSTKLQTDPVDLVARSQQELPESVSEMLAELLSYARALGYDEAPDYGYLKARVDQVMAQEGYTMDYEYDWGNRVPSGMPLFGRFNLPSFK
uniref:non-specific serine/threonine protein kinase n=2 Tax=Hemiselmis andersenii TaxID=464988 RepID=A0A6U2FQ37_HEMAN|mmetsp:Transcript_33040/g.77276  ORF Transcript_33040/g.77276 Transcript_33040/m.77276 type:complete len:431 (+) Transcript_33040:173-1465(+)